MPIAILNYQKIILKKILFVKTAKKYLMKKHSVFSARSEEDTFFRLTTQKKGPLTVILISI